MVSQIIQPMKERVLEQHPFPLHRAPIRDCAPQLQSIAVRTVVNKAMLIRVCIPVAMAASMGSGAMGSGQAQFQPAENWHALRGAVNDWCNDPTNTPGMVSISDWDMSLITDMYDTFLGKNCVDSSPDLSKWDVSRVTVMQVC